MSIIEYLESDHPAGFVGLRVIVVVKGNYRQKYFKYRESGEYLPDQEIQRLKQCAADLEKKWQNEQAANLASVYQECKEVKINSIYTTGVKGVKMKFLIEKKFREGRMKTYYTPIFDVYGSTQGRRFFKKFNIITLQYSNAWQKAVNFYAEHKGIIQPSHLINREPPVEKFLIIAQTLNQQGHKIPNRRLPLELWGKKQILDHAMEVQTG
ncbi:MAG: hypothetical protein V3U75_06270 [Methylococcaceae bacterium]